MPDCITLLNRLSSAANEVRSWHKDGVTVRFNADNSRVIAQVSGDLKQARTAYDKAMECVNSKEARSSRAYAQARPRFAKDFPKHQKTIQAGGAEFAVFRAAIEVNNTAVALTNRIKNSKASAYDAEVEHAKKSLEEFKQVTISNSFLSGRWFASVDNSIDERLRYIKGKKTNADRATSQKKMIASAVVKRLPGFTREDAMDPRKVAEALQMTPASEYVAALMGESFVYQKYQPVKVKHPKETRLGREYPDGEKPKTRAFVFYNQNVMFVRYTDDKLPRTEEAIPGLVWDVDENDRIMNASQAAYEKCTKKLWKAKESAFDRLDTANILYSAREARKDALAYKVRQSIDRKCKSHRKKYSKAWDSAMAEYTKLRSQAAAGRCRPLQAAAGRLSELAK